MNNVESRRIFDEKYSESKLVDFYIKTEKLYEFFGYEFKLNQKKEQEKIQKFYGGKVWINDTYKNSVISNLKIIDLNLFYPRIISKSIRCNLENYNKVYSKVIDFYRNSKDDIENRKLLKEYINSVYGVLQNPKSDIYSDNMDSVSIFSNNIMSKILNEFESHIVYIDTDEIFFRNFEEIEQRFKNYFNSINKYDLTYDTLNSKFGMFLEKKRYVYELDGNIKLKGLQHFNQNGLSRGGNINLNM